jgi:hypothetical protein
MRTILLNFRVTRGEKASYERAAEGAGLSLTGWIKKQLEIPAFATVKAEESTQDDPQRMIPAPPNPDPSQLLCNSCFRWVCQHCGPCRRLLKGQNN